MKTITGILALTLLVSCAVCADRIFKFEPSHAPHYLFQFLEGFDLNDNFPQSSICNKTSTVIASDFVRDYSKVFEDGEWNKEGIIQFAKTLGEVPDWLRNCMDTFNYINKNVNSYRSQFRTSSEFYDSMVENLQNSLVGIFTQVNNLSSTFKKQSLKESEFNLLLLDLGKLARTVFDFENINRLLLFTKVDNIELENTQERGLLLEATADFNQIIDLVSGFLGTLVEDVISEKSLKDSLNGCSANFMLIENKVEESMVNDDTLAFVDSFKFFEGLAVNCISSFEGVGDMMVGWIEDKIPTTSQLLTNLLVQMGDISSYFNQAKLHLDGFSRDRFTSAGKHLAKGLQLLFHNVDFKKDQDE